MSSAVHSQGSNSGSASSSQPSSGSSGSGSKDLSRRWNQGTEFLAAPRLLNAVPPLPSGPFFKKMDLVHKFEEFGAYHVTSLEKHFVWKPHVNVAQCLDLVDQESLIPSTSAGAGVVPGLVGTARKTGTSSLDVSKIPWLKKTTYLTNNLYDNVNQFKGDEEIIKGKNAQTKAQIKVHHDAFAENFIDYTFEAVAAKTARALEASKENLAARRKVEWVVPVLPDDALWGSNLNLLRFDNDPMADDDLRAIDKAASLQVLDSIVTNIRALPQKATDVSTESRFAISLVANDGTAAENYDVTNYKWVRDFKMQVKGSNLDDSFLFVLDADANGDKVLTYAPLNSNVELKRISKEECSEHTATVKRLRSEETEGGSKRHRHE